MLWTFPHHLKSRFQSSVTSSVGQLNKPSTTNTLDKWDCLGSTSSVRSWLILPFICTLDYALALQLISRSSSQNKSKGPTAFRTKLYSDLARNLRICIWDDIEVTVYWQRQAILLTVSSNFKFYFTHKERASFLDDRDKGSVRMNFRANQSVNLLATK